MKNLIIIHILILWVASFGCTQKGTDQTNSDAGDRQDTIGIKAEKLRNEWQQKLSAMNIEELHKQLQKESLQGMEPFNSMTLKETITRRENSFDELAKLVLQDESRASFLSLMALRNMDREKYHNLSDTLKADILLDALKNAKTFNAFGLPHVRWEAAARAVMEGEEAMKNGLRTLLTDKREAPVWGSEDYMEYLHYKYRVCDYAYALLTSDGEPVALPVKPEERDRLIDEYLEQK